MIKYETVHSIDKKDKEVFTLQVEWCSWHCLLTVVQPSEKGIRPLQWAETLTSSCRVGNGVGVHMDVFFFFSPVCELILVLSVNVYNY